ncbi:MAG: hypothetical protein WC569_03050 [Candidatus Omnitrophota bacterium]
MKKTVIIAMLLFTATALYADTVIMKDKSRMKGLVVEEYVDRVMLSTVDGERMVFRADIDRIEYDTPEQNFMQMGRSYEAKGWYDKAAFYYKKAMEINPDYKEAREAYLASHARLWRDEERRVNKEMELQIAASQWRNKSARQISTASVSKEDLLKKTLGISLLEKDGVFVINEVVSNSSAFKAGIRKGDVLVGIWGKLIRYSDKEEILAELLGPKYSEVRVMIEKDILVAADRDSVNKNLYKELGISLGFEYEGLALKDLAIGKKGYRAGLKKGDFIMAVDKNMTRYLPMDSVIALINSAGNKEVVFTIRRNVNLRRENR